MSNIFGITGWSVVTGVFPGAGIAADFAAWIETDQADGLIVVKPYCRATTGRSVVYRFVSWKTGTGGTTRSTQSGRADLQPGVVEPLATLNWNLSREDHYRLELEIYEGSELVATASVDYPPHK